MDEHLLERGFTKVPNCIITEIMRRQFSSVDIKIIMLVLRYTYGFLRERAELPISLFTAEIGSRSVVSRHIRQLISTGVLTDCGRNPVSKIRLLKVNSDFSKWGVKVDRTGTSGVDQTGTSGVDRTETSGVDQTETSGVDQTGTSGVDQMRNYQGTVGDTNKENININIYKKISERVSIPQKIDEAITRWLSYKTERGEKYGRIPLSTLVKMIIDRVSLYGEDAVADLIDDCISSGYKNIVWERLRIKEAKASAKRDNAFMSDYDHEALEKLTRGDRNE